MSRPATRMGNPRATARLGTPSSSTLVTRRPARRTCTFTADAGVSTTTTPSRGGFNLPVSTRAVTAPNVPCTHMSTAPPPSMKTRPRSAPRVAGGTTTAPNITTCPRGSHMSARRVLSWRRRRSRERAFIVRPRSSGKPLSTMRVGSPRVWVSIVSMAVTLMRPASPARRGPRLRPHPRPRSRDPTAPGPAPDSSGAGRSAGGRRKYGGSRGPASPPLHGCRE